MINEGKVRGQRDQSEEYWTLHVRGYNCLELGECQWGWLCVLKELTRSGAVWPVGAKRKGYQR